MRFCVASDLLSVDGEDIRSLRLTTRKLALRCIMPRWESRVRFLEHVHGRGVDLFGVACERTLEVWCEMCVR